MPSLLRNYYEIGKQATRYGMGFPFGKFYPCIGDKDQKSGTASVQYFHQDLLVANKIFINKPVKHVDIGSHVDGFVAHVAPYLHIEVFDIRDMTERIQDIHFKRLDIMVLVGGIRLAINIPLLVIQTP